MKTKLELEFALNTSPKILFSRLSSASGLSEWFADDVHVNGEIFTFIWGGSDEKAEMILKKEQQFVRFHWADDEDSKTYFEFKIHKDELTGDSALLITDFVEEEDLNDSRELWNSQIGSLKHILGL